MSIFKKTSGLVGEDISTEILAYLLTPNNPNTPSSSFVPFQKLFFNRIIGQPLSSSDLQVEIQTQSSFFEGRPDAVILTSTAIIVIENKLGSYLSSDDQLIRYANVLNDINVFKKIFPLIDIANVTDKYLVFLAPSKIMDFSVVKTNQLLNGKSEGDIHSYCEERNATFVKLSWEDVLSDTDNSNALQNELFLYVKDYINQELTMDEINILKDANVPFALEKLYKRIEGVRDSLYSHDYKAGRIGQSYIYYGFNTDFTFLKAWFGYALPVWKEYGAPAVIQIREEWIAKDKVEDVIDILRKHGFQKDENHEYIMLFFADDIADWVEKLEKIFKELE